VLAVDENEDLFETPGTSDVDARDAQDFVQVILDTLKTSGVQQAHKEDKVASLQSLHGQATVSAPRVGIWSRMEPRSERRSLSSRVRYRIPSRSVSAAREAGDADFDVLITCAFNYDAHSSEFNKLGRIPVLKAP